MRSSGRFTSIIVITSSVSEEMGTNHNYHQRPMFLTALALLHGAGVVVALDNGLGLTPPQGWRSWNLFGADVNQSLIQGIMSGMVSKKRTVDGVPTSLCDLGYCDVGLDDNWQECGSYGDEGYTYHAASGDPVVNENRFPSLGAMTEFAHGLGLTAGWYGNNCICEDHCGNGKVHGEETDEGKACYAGDVSALISSFNFDSVKLDGCGDQMNLDLWSAQMNATGKAVMIENCHWGHTVPHEDGWCPFNFYRTSMDVRASYASVIHNLLTTVPFAQRNLSAPSCWAYPDMLEVGCAHGPGGDHDPGLTAAETRSHFGAWCIVSSPLTLSMDVNNDTIMDAVWPVVANPEAIAVNQAWGGHSGSPFKTADAGSGGAADLRFKTPRGAAEAGVALPGATTRALEEEEEEGKEKGGGRSGSGSGSGSVEVAFSVPAWQYFYKPLAQGKGVAVLLMNHLQAPQDLALALSDVPGLGAVCGGSGQLCAVRDVWAREDVGTFAFAGGAYTAANLEAHDSAFLTISAVPSK